LRDSLTIDMLLSALSFLVVAQSSSEIPEGLMNNPVYLLSKFVIWQDILKSDTLMTAKITTSYHVTSRSLAEIYRIFGEILCCILYCRQPIS